MTPTTPNQLTSDGIVFVNHTGRISGAELSMVELLERLPARASPHVVCPPGRLSDSLAARGIPVHPISEIEGSLKLDPKGTTLAILQMAAAARTVRRVVGATSACLVYAASIRAGLIATLPVGRGGPPVAVCVQDCLTPTPAARLVERLVGRRAALVMPNSEHTARVWLQGEPRSRVAVTHLGVELDRYDPDRTDGPSARRALGIPADAPVLTMVAQLTPWKGQDVAIEAIARVRQQFPEVRLLLIGSAVFTSNQTRFDNESYVRGLERSVEELGLTGTIQFLGQRSDIPDLLAASDLLLQPSWEEPFGRSVIEAMASGVPPLATAVGGPAELIADGQDGRLLPPRDPDAWAAAIRELLANPVRRRSLGAQARRSAERYSVERYVQNVLVNWKQRLGVDFDVQLDGAHA